MYIDPFVAGIGVGVIGTLIVIICWAYYVGRKDK